MSGVVNLRTERKRRKRAVERAEAGVRAAAAGEGKAGRKLRAAESELATRRLEQHRRDEPRDS